MTLRTPRTDEMKSPCRSHYSTSTASWQATIPRHHRSQLAGLADPLTRINTSVLVLGNAYASRRPPVGLCVRTSHCEMLVNAANQGSIAPTNNQLFQDRSKQIDIQFHFTPDLVKQKMVPSQLCTYQGHGWRPPYGVSTLRPARIPLGRIFS